MKIDMSPFAITQRLHQVEELRRICLALAKSNVAQQIRRRQEANKEMESTSNNRARFELPE